MTKRFSSADIDRIDRLWRALPAGHEWTGWACAGADPDRVFVFRTRAHWRRFALRKTASGYELTDEGDGAPIAFASLTEAADTIAAVPGLAPRAD